MVKIDYVFVMVFFVVSIILFSNVSADVVSVNAGGYENLVVDNNGVNDFFFSTELSNATIVVSPVCGNAVLETGEGCDDGNIVNGDGCSAGCVVEDGGGGGGGGGGSVSTAIEVTIFDLSAVPESLNLPATVGVQTKGKLSLTNNGYDDLNLTWSVVALGDMISFDDDKFFVLTPRETKILEFFVLPNESGIHTGKFVFTNEVGVFEVPVVLNTNSELSLFDIVLDLSEEMRVINVGEDVVGQISLIQMGLQSNVDVVMNYVIKDFLGKTYLTQTETIKVNKEKSYSHTFQTENLPTGDYIVGAEVIYAGGVATASSQFKVVSEDFSWWWILVIISVIVLVIVSVSAKLYKKGK